MIETRDSDGIRVLTLAHGKANVLDTEFFGALEGALAAAASEAVKAVVLTGTGSIFSAGVDLYRVVNGGKAYLEIFLPALSLGLERLFTFSKPVVAAVNGHAIAGGCILACACDVRIGARGNGRIGVPELRVGVPFPAAALEVVRFAVGEQKLPRLVFGGATYSPDEALALGLLDRVVEPESLMDSAFSEARALSQLGARAFAFSKKQVRQQTVETIHRRSEQSDLDVLGMWSSPDTQAAIRTYLKATLGR
jgi:enoyl-CoA hydratase